jgi:two-component system chemotaxis response regulator CheB
VVDDSAFARKVLREALGSDSRIEVVGFARDGLEALESIAELKPDVVTLDLMMPHLDGVGVLRELASMATRPKVVVVSISGEESEVVVSALQLGAVELVRKPTALATDRLYELSGDLIRAVLNAASAQAPSRSLRAPVAAPASKRETDLEVLVVGTSTGGPHALTTLLSSLPADLPVAVAVALHIPAEYTEALAKRLDSVSPLNVVEARVGLVMKPGMVVIAKGGMHLTLAREGADLVTRLSARPESVYVPSVDQLFASAARAAGNKVLGVVLTGMGDDGSKGARAIVEAGGRVLTESESSCVVYGMPRAVRDAGCSAGEARIDEMADAIVRRL